MWIICFASVKNITEEGIIFTNGSRLDAATVVWTAGVSGIAPNTKTKMPVSPNKRILVLPTLQMADYPNVYVAGDLAFREERGAPLPMIAPVAIQEGKHAAENILRDAAGGNPRPFSYRDRGAMVTIGRNTAVVRIGAKEFRGFIAWIIWIIIHIVNLIGFRNKLFVIVNWIWDYLFFERSVRLILPGCWNNSKMTGCFHRNARRSCDGA